MKVTCESDNEYDHMGSQKGIHVDMPTCMIGPVYAVGPATDLRVLITELQRDCK
jgi:hypothetical protein